MDLIIRQSHGLIKFSSIVPWDSNPGKTVIIFQIFFFLQKSTERSNGFNSFQDMVHEVRRVFDINVSSSYVRKLRRDDGK